MTSRLAVPALLCLALGACVATDDDVSARSKAFMNDKHPGDPARIQALHPESMPQYSNGVDGNERRLPVSLGATPHPNGPVVVNP
jgi:hypothetical protein